MTLYVLKYQTHWTLSCTKFWYQTCWMDLVVVSFLPLLAWRMANALRNTLSHVYLRPKRVLTVTHCTGEEALKMVDM